MDREFRSRGFAITWSLAQFVQSAPNFCRASSSSRRASPTRFYIHSSLTTTSTNTTTILASEQPNIQQGIPRTQLEVIICNLACYEEKIKEGYLDLVSTPPTLKTRDDYTGVKDSSTRISQPSSSSIEASIQVIKPWAQTARKATTSFTNPSHE